MHSLYQSLNKIHIYHGSTVSLYVPKKFYNRNMFYLILSEGNLWKKNAMGSVNAEALSAKVNNFLQNQLLQTAVLHVAFRLAHKQWI